MRYAEIWEVPKTINKRYSGAWLCILCLLLLLGELAHGHVSFCEAESRMKMKSAFVVFSAVSAAIAASASAAITPGDFVDKAEL